MPGLVGLIGELPHQLSEEKLKSMFSVTRHELTYNYGTYTAADMCVYVGWTTHERSFSDCMPIVNEKQDVILFLAGEVFTTSDLILGLRAKGHEFSKGDASYLVHLYEEMGDGFFRELNGWFSGFLIDKRRGKSFLFNDRFGMHRIFIHRGPSAFYFSSEAKSLLAVLPETRSFDPKSLCEYLTCDCTLGDTSLFKGIEVLPGGTLVEFVKGELTKQAQYFDRATWERQTHITADKFFLHIIELFPDIAKRYLASREAVAISLTGGLDSRMVMACLDLRPDAVPCYTFGSVYRDTYDVTVSRQVARACEQSHETLVLDDNFLSELPNYIEKAVYVSDGYLGLSGAAELYANSLARKIAPIRLTGNYGGEVLRGVRAFKYTKPRDLILNPDLTKYIGEAENSFRAVSRMDKVSFATFQQAPHQGYGRLAIERSQVDLRTPFFDNDLLALVYTAPDSYDGFALAEAVIAKCKPALLDIPSDRGYLGCDGTLSKLMRRIYRKSLFKAEYWIGHGAPDWLVRQMHSFGLEKLEAMYLGRHKFYHMRVWQRDILEKYIRDILMHDTSSDVSSYFNYKELASTLDAHFQQRKNYADEIDRIMTIALTKKLLFDTA